MKQKPDRISSNGLAILTKDTNDALETTAYLCPANKLTIGYGHVLQPFYDYTLFPPMSVGTLKRIISECQAAHRVTKECTTLLHINAAQALTLLQRDTHQTGEFIKSVVHTRLNQNQFDALVCLVFNIGQGAFAKSTLKTLLNADNFSAAGKEFNKWVYGSVFDKKLGRAVKTKLPGLITRRASERQLFETPTNS